MSFILLTSSLSTPIFAGRDKMLTLPIKYLKKSTAPKETIRGESKSSLQRKRRAVQKAFLTALLCSQNIDVEVNFNPRNLSTTYDNFFITKIGESTVCTKNIHNNTAQVKALQQHISENMKNIKFDFGLKGSAISCININGNLLNQNTIYKIGEKVLEIIENRRKDLILSKIYKTNLGKDDLFVQELSNILGDLLNSDSTEDKNTLKFFELPSEGKKPLDPVTNPVHINYLKKHPENSSLIIACYQKIFLASILSAFGINISAKQQTEETDGIFPECVKLIRINKYHIHTIKPSCKFLTSMIKSINEIVPAEKLKIETIPMSYSVPTRITIGNIITLDENDIFNLGQKFYNLIDEMLSKGTIKPAYYFYLYQSNEFIQGVKKIFKEYTGKNLPDLE